MHGGAHGSGAPSGTRNGAYRHGVSTIAAQRNVRQLRAWLKIAKAGIEDSA
jgi:hypothetical protein